MKKWKPIISSENGDSFDWKGVFGGGLNKIIFGGIL